MKKRPNNTLIRAMAMGGYTFADMAAGYEANDPAYAERVLADNALALNRPVLDYGILGIDPCESWCFNYSPHGFRLGGADKAWPPDPQRTNIFFMGGSSAVGYNVEDWQTIPFHFEAALIEMGLDCRVYNFGSGNYTSRQEALRLLTLFDAGLEPDFVFFLDGYNDSYYAFGGPSLRDTFDRLYRAEKRRQRETRLERVADRLRHVLGGDGAILPAALDLDDSAEADAREFLTDAAVDAAIAASTAPMALANISPAGVRIAKRVWRRYLDSKLMAEALCHGRKTMPIFLWQPARLFKMRQEQGLLIKLIRLFSGTMYSSPTYHWLHAAGFPGVENGARFIDLSDAAMAADGILYLDECHYTGNFNRQIADHLATLCRPFL
jgi:hypothetical protein